MIGKKITDKITSVSKKKPDKKLHKIDETEDLEIATPEKRYISPEERKQIIEELRLVPKEYVWIKVNIKKRQQIIYNLRPLL